MKPYHTATTSINFLKHALRAAILLTAGYAFPAAANAQEVIFHNEASDTTRLTGMLIEECGHDNPGNVSRIARSFIGTPYVAGTLEGDSVETLRVNIDQLDCTTFVETVLALAYTANENRQSWRDFVYNLRRIRYRNGEVNGYPSRLHYVSDWILDNSSRGNLKEITGNLAEARYQIKSLDFMTAHHDLYPALADSMNIAGMKNVESGFSNHRYPYLKGSSLNDKKLAKILQDGDVVCFTTSTKGLDVTHTAIAVIIDGSARMIHASSKAGKVILDPLSIAEYVRRNRADGIRVVRLVKD